MSSNIIKDKTLSFALRIVKLYKYLTKTQKEFVLSKQILRSGTSIGAQIREGENAESSADFIHKMSIAQKEANETDYWLEILHRSSYIDKNAYISLNTDLTEIKKIITAIIVTSKNKL